VFRIVRYDTRGHGRSGVPAGSATIERLGRDLLALLDHLSIVRAQLCGLSLGGLTAQWLAVYHPERVSRLVLANTAARIGSIEGWGERIAAVRQGGMAAVRNAVLARFFSPAFSLAHPQTLQVYAAMLTATDPQGYAACCAALREADLRAEVGSITAPTLIIAGALDEATPPAQAEELRAAIPGSELVVLDEVAHLSNIERPDAFNSLLLGA
jgi:3-oxoadipate enol-lactonase